MPKPTEAGAEACRQIESSSPGLGRTCPPKEEVSGTKHHVSFSEKWGEMGLSLQGMKKP